LVPGNFFADRCDYPDVACERFREALSARLDGEDDPGETAALDAHLETCAACRQWADDAQAVTRLARISFVGDPAELDVAKLLAATAPAQAKKPEKKKRPRLSKALRMALGAFGAAQFVLGILQTVGSAGVGHDHDGSSVNPGHLWHESAAWNVAIGAGFAWIALRRSRPSGTLPMLTAFVALLALLSVNDIAQGRVDTLRLLSHGFVVAGYVIVVALCRPSLDPGKPPAGRQGPPWRWRVQLDDTAPPATPAGPPSLRLIRGNLHHVQPQSGDDRKAA
jgi:predicted anti-sigma-YlaC factor YlaD